MVPQSNGWVALKLRRKRRPMMEKKMTICLSSETNKNKRSILINITIHLLLIIPSRQYIYLLLSARSGDIVLQYIFLQDWLGYILHTVYKLIFSHLTSSGANYSLIHLFFIPALHPLALCYYKVPTRRLK